MSSFTAPDEMYCRFCALKRPNGYILTLHLNSTAYSEIEEKLAFLNAEYVDLSNADPLHICLSCDSSLKSAYEFMLKVQKAQATLSGENSSLMIKAELVDSDLVKAEIDELKGETWSQSENHGSILFATLQKNSTTPKNNADRYGTDESFMLNYDGVPMFMFTEEMRSWNMYSWLCTKCDNVFTDIKELRLHSENVHGCCANFKCGDCGVFYSTFKDFIEHVRGHWECLRNYCDICNFCYDNALPADHNSTHEDHFNCQRCGKLFLSLTDYNVHKEKYGGKVKKSKKPYTPVVCPVKETKPVENTDDGEKRSWIDYPWSCTVCAQTFDSVGDLRKHGEEDHGTCFCIKCADCDEFLGFPTYKAFARHAVTHRNYLKNYCEYCNTKYTTDVSKQEHQVVHDKHYICKRCGTLFDTLAEYNCHAAKLNLEPKKVKRKELALPPRVLPQNVLKKIADKSWSGYPWTCRLCDVTAKDLDALRAHSKEVHKTCFTIKCADCERLVDSFQDFVYHAKRHRPFLRRRCIFCNVRFTAEIKEAEHVVTHFPDAKMLCEGCGETLPNLDELVAHLTLYNCPKASHEPHLKYKTDMTMECRICEKVTTSLNSFRRHLSTHNSGFKEHFCEICAKSYTSKASLEKHFLGNHSDAQLAPCPLCNKYFKTHLRLKLHMKTHNASKPFSCEVCSQSFRDMIKLRRHYKVHMTERPFECQHCGKTFKQNMYLKRHLHQHTGERPYICKDCGMSFTNWGNCNKHTVRRHGKKFKKAG